MTTPTAIYESLMWEIRKHLHDLGMTMRQCDNVSGLQDGYVAKMMHPNTDSGRQAHWRTVQELIDALYPGGVRITIRPIAAMAQIKQSINRKLANETDVLSGLSMADGMAKKGHLGRMQLRDLASMAGRKGNESRNRKLTPRQRQILARKAIRARWRKVRRKAAEITATIEASERRQPTEEVKWRK